MIFFFSKRVMQSRVHAINEVKIATCTQGGKMRGLYLTRDTKKWQSGLARKACSSWLDRKWLPSASLRVRAFPDIHENVRAPMGVFSLRNEGGKTEWTHTQHAEERRTSGGRTDEGLEGWTKLKRTGGGLVVIQWGTAFQTAFHSGAGANGVGEMSDLK